jgi:hypothetical protein
MPASIDVMLVCQRGRSYCEHAHCISGRSFLLDTHRYAKIVAPLHVNTVATRSEGRISVARLEAHKEVLSLRKYMHWENVMDVVRSWPCPVPAPCVTQLLPPLAGWLIE